MKINSLVLVACALVTGCASNQPTQPTSKTYVIGDEKLLTPQSKEYKPTGREYVTATIIEVREFDLQGMPSGVVKDTASVTFDRPVLLSFKDQINPHIKAGPQGEPVVTVYINNKPQYGIKFIL